MHRQMHKQFGLKSLTVKKESLNNYSLTELQKQDMI